MKKLYVLMFALLTSVVAMAQVTTSNMSGKITDANGEPLVGATVIAVHTPSGTEYYAVANTNGEYRLGTSVPVVLTPLLLRCSAIARWSVRV